MHLILCQQLQNTIVNRAKFLMWFLVVFCWLFLIGFQFFGFFCLFGVLLLLLLLGGVELGFFIILINRLKLEELKLVVSWCLSGLWLESFSLQPEPCLEQRKVNLFNIHPSPNTEIYTISISNHKFPFQAQKTIPFLGGHKYLRILIS